GPIWGLAMAYAGVALLEQSFKLALYVYRGWVSEDAVRPLRRTIHADGHSLGAEESQEVGTHAAMVVAEAEPIGGFVGLALSEPPLPAGILLSGVGYVAF